MRFAFHCDISLPTWKLVFHCDTSSFLGQVLRVVFPKLFLDAHPDTQESTKYVWCSDNFAVYMCESSTAGRDNVCLGRNYPGTSSLGCALIRAMDSKDETDMRLREAGLEDNLWMVTLDASKRASARDAVQFYRGKNCGGAGGKYRKLLDQIEKMKVGDLARRSGGWSGDDGGHCVVCVVEKTSPTTFALTMCNSGQGLGVHPGVPLYNCPGPINNYPTSKSLTAFRVDHFDLTSAAVRDLGNWYYFHRCNEFGDRLHPTLNYCLGMPCLIGKNLRRAVRDSPDLQGWPSTAQRGPTCGYRAPVKAFQYVLRRYGFSKDDIKEVTLAQRIFYVAWAGEQLAAIRRAAGQRDAPLAAAGVPNAGYQGRGWTGGGFDPAAPREMTRTLGKTEYLVIDDACHRLCLAALKTHDRGRASDGTLRLCVALARRVRQLLPRASAYWCRLPRPLPAFKSEGAASHSQRQQQLPLETLLDWPAMDLERCAGPLQTGAFPPTLDPAGALGRVRSAATLREGVAALGGLLSLVGAIRARFDAAGNAAVGRLHVLGLLHACFALGQGAAVVPTPAEARGTAADSSSLPCSPWTRGPITAHLQETLLAHLIGLACELAAAAKSLPRARDADALSAVAVAHLVAIGDAALLCPATEGEEAADGRPRELVFRPDYAELGLWARACDGTRLADVTAGAPLLWPAACRVRADVQDYLDHAEARSKWHFLNWTIEEDREKQVCFRIHKSLSPLDPTITVFCNAAEALGYRPCRRPDAVDKNLAAQTPTAGGGQFPPPVEGDAARDVPDETVRGIAIRKTVSKAGGRFEGLPDEQCGIITEHHLLCGWALGTQDNNKLLAHPEGRPLCDLRDLVLLLKIMLEPPSLNAARPVGRALDPGKICLWGPAHARPVLTCYKNDIGRSVYDARLVGLCAFNRPWVLGRRQLPAACDLRCSGLSTSVKWDAVALQSKGGKDGKPGKGEDDAGEPRTEDDVLHAPQIPTFDGALSSEGAEALLSFLTVPSVRASLVLRFFADSSRLPALFNAQLRRIIWSAVFSPGEWPEGGAAKAIEVVPAAPARLRARLGLLLVELRTAPGLVLGSCASIVQNAIRAARTSDFMTPYSGVFFFSIRLAVCLLQYAQQALEEVAPGPSSAGGGTPNRHWALDGFSASGPPHAVLEELSTGVCRLAELLRLEALPVVRAWIEDATAAANGDVGPQADGDGVTGEAAGWGGHGDDPGPPRQKAARELAVTASAHLVLLADPCLCPNEGRGGGGYPVDDTGEALVAASGAAMAYLSEWHGKGLASVFYGRMDPPPTAPPRWRGPPARMVFSGEENLWPALDRDPPPSQVPDMDPGALGMPPHHLWTTLAQRRAAVDAWFRAAARDGAPRACRALSALAQATLGDPHHRWGLDARGVQTLMEPAPSALVFTAPCGRTRLDVHFAELLFLGPREGAMAMPERVGADPGLRAFLRAERRGRASSVMPRVVATELRRWRQCYLLPSVRSGDAALGLHFWEGVPLGSGDGGPEVTGMPTPQDFTGLPRGVSGHRSHPAVPSSGGKAAARKAQGTGLDADPVVFRGVAYGGPGRTARCGACRSPMLRLTTNLPPPDEVLPGCRYDSSIMRDFLRKPQGGAARSRHWRLVALRGTSDTRWEVRRLRFLDAAGAAIDACDAEAICSGSISPELGPENATGSRSEGGPGDAGSADRPWVCQLYQKDAEAVPATSSLGDDDDAQGLYLGLAFREPVEVQGFELLQQARPSSGVPMAVALTVDLQSLSEMGQWITCGSFPLPEAERGETATRGLRGAPGRGAAESSSPETEDDGGVRALQRVLASPEENWWGELLLLAIRPALIGAVFDGDGVVMLLPAFPGCSDTATVLLCNPSKPSPYRWSFVSLQRAHGTAAVYALREYGRRAYGEMVWTSDYGRSRVEILPRTKFEMRSTHLPHPFVARAAGSFLDLDPSRGAWFRGGTALSSLLIRRTVAGEPQTLVPTHFLGGVLPDALARAFRFWRSGDDGAGALVAESLPDADDSWFGYDLRIVARGGPGSESGITRPGSDPAIAAVNQRIRQTKALLAASPPSRTNSGGEETRRRETQRTLEGLRRQRSALDAEGSAAAATDLLEGALDVDILRSRPDPTDPGRMVKHRLVGVVDPATPRDSWLGRVCELMLRIENAAHVLLWAACDHDDGKDERTRRLHDVLEIIELPRLRLRFTTGFDAGGSLRIWSVEHAGRFVLADLHEEPMDEGLRRVVSVTPFSLFLGDAEGNRFLLVPSCPYDPRAAVTSQPWAGVLFPRRDDPSWLSTLEVRVYIYKIHESRLWLEMPSLEAALLWAFLQLSDRRVAECAQTIDSMSSDEPLSPQETFQLKRFEDFRGQHASNASEHLMSKLWLRFRDSPVARAWPWEHQRNPTHVTGLDRHHTPACARISHEEERTVLSRVGGHQRRLDYLDAIDAKVEEKTYSVGLSLADESGEGFRRFMVERGPGTAYAILKDAVAAAKADASSSFDRGWVRLEATRFEGHKDAHAFDTLEGAKAAYLRMLDDPDRPRGITFCGRRYTLCFCVSVKADRQHTAWYYAHAGRPDARGTRALLWNAPKVKFSGTPWPEGGGRRKRVTGRPLLGSSGLLNAFLHGDLSGRSGGLGFLWACLVYEGAYEFTVDGSQDNTQSLMQNTIHLYYRDQGTRAGLGVSNALPMAILAVLAGHALGSVPDFPSILGPGSLFAAGRVRELLAKGQVAGSHPLLHPSVREETDPDSKHFHFHLGGFMEKAAQACLAFLDSGDAEKRARVGTALFEPPLSREDYIVPADPCVIKVADGRHTVPICSLDNRLQRTLPRPADFSCCRFELAASDGGGAGGCGVGASELVAHGSYPLLELTEQGPPGEKDWFVSPGLPPPRADAVRAHRTERDRERKRQEAEVEALKGDAAKRPRLPLPLPADHPALRSRLGAAMVERFEKSLVEFRQRHEQSKRDGHALGFGGGAASSASIQRGVVALYEACQRKLRETVQAVREESRRLEEELNRNTLAPATGGYTGPTGYLRFQCAKVAWLEPHVELPLLLGSVLSHRGVEQLRDANPLLDRERARALLDAAAVLMLRTTLVTQLRGTLMEIREAFPEVVCGFSGPADLTRRSTAGIAARLTVRRHWCAVGADATLTFDPRFLAFEFVSSFVLWERQTRLVNEFSEAALAGGSQAQQMIMGDGKTTVVGPLLALILGGPDTTGGGKAVTLVCPKALIAQSKAIMRQIFSAPLIPKPVMTLHFDRGNDSRVSSLRALRLKLETAHRELAILVASPIALKSYFLKYIELLVMLRANRDGGRGADDPPEVVGVPPSVGAPPRPSGAWYAGPRRWRVGCCHPIRVATRPDAHLPFVPSRLCLVPAPGSRCVLVARAGSCITLDLPADCTVVSAWYGDRGESPQDRGFSALAKMRGWFAELVARRAADPLCPLGTLPTPVDGDALGGDPHGDDPALFLTVDLPREISDVQMCRMACSTDAFCPVLSEEEVGAPGATHEIPLSRLPNRGTYCLVWLRGSPEGTKLLHEAPPSGGEEGVGQRSSGVQPGAGSGSPSAASYGGCEIHGLPVGIDIVPLCSEADQQLAPGAVLGMTGPRGGARPQRFDPTRGYALVNRSGMRRHAGGIGWNAGAGEAGGVSGAATGGEDRLSWRPDTLRCLVRDEKGAPDYREAGVFDEPFVTFLGLSGDHAASRRSLRGNSDHYVEWYIVPAGHGQGLFRIECFAGICPDSSPDPYGMKHLGFQEEKKQRRGYPLRMRELDKRDGSMRLPPDAQHVWRVVLDAQRSAELGGGKRVWNIVYAGPVARAVGWALSCAQYDDAVILADPEAAGCKLEEGEGRHQAFLRGPTAWEIVESGFSLDYRPPPRGADSLSRKHLVSLEVAPPTPASCPFVVPGSNCLPFYIANQKEETFQDESGQQRPWSRVTFGCSAHGCPYEVHFCHSGARDIGAAKSVRRVLLPAGAVLKIARRLALAEARIEHATTETHALAIFEGGFPKVGHTSGVHVRGGQELGGPPPGGCVIVAVELSPAVSLTSGPCHAGLPRRVASYPGHSVVEIDTGLESGHWCAAEVHADNGFESHRRRLGAVRRLHTKGKPCRMKAQVGWVEYAVTFAEAGLVDVSLLYTADDWKGVNLYVNGACVDRALCYERTGSSEDIKAAAWSRSFAGPHRVRRGVNRFRLCANATEYTANWLATFPDILRMKVEWVALSAVPEMAAPTVAALRRLLTCTKPGVQAGLSSPPADRPCAPATSFRLLPDAFGIHGAVALMAAGAQNTVVGLPCAAAAAGQSAAAAAAGTDESGETAPDKDDVSAAGQPPPLGAMASGSVTPGVPLMLNEAPLAVARALQGRSSALDACSGAVVGVFVSCKGEDKPRYVQYIRFDYASGASRSHGCLRDRLGEAYFAVPPGHFIREVEVWNKDGKQLRALRVRCSSLRGGEVASPVLGRADAPEQYAAEWLAAAPGQMIDWLTFRADVDACDCPALLTRAPLQSPIQTADPAAVALGRELRRWSRGSAFYPRLGKWFADTVAFELVACPGCFVVAAAPASSQSEAPHLTIERLEAPRLQYRDARNKDPARAYGGHATGTLPSLPLCLDTYRRASFLVRDLEAADATEVAEMADLADAGEADDDLGAAADEIGHVLRRWRARGVLLLDEVDMLLHPLKSELNFPIGKQVAIDVDVEAEGAAGFAPPGEEAGDAGPSATAENLPKGLRWDLPLAILDSILEAHRRISQAPGTPSPDPSAFVSGLMRCFLRGRREGVVQRVPHLVLLDGRRGGAGAQSVTDEMLHLCAKFALGWIESRALIRYRTPRAPSPVPYGQLLAYVLCPEGEPWPHKARFDAALAPATLQLLGLARLWVSCFCAHALKKINRVNYGLLRGAQLRNEAGSFFGVADTEAPGPAAPASRLLLALPFDGLEQPSDSAEFAHPDVAIGLTILAFRHEGLRQEDLLVLIRALKGAFNRGSGPPEQRPEWVLWNQWTEGAILGQQLWHGDGEDQRGHGGGVSRAGSHPVSAFGTTSVQMVPPPPPPLVPQLSNW